MVNKKKNLTTHLQIQNTIIFLTQHEKVLKLVHRENGNLKSINLTGHG